MHPIPSPHCISAAGSHVAARGTSLASFFIFSFRSARSCSFSRWASVAEILLPHSGHLSASVNPRRLYWQALQGRSDRIVCESIFVIRYCRTRNIDVMRAFRLFLFHPAQFHSVIWPRFKPVLRYAKAQDGSRNRSGPSAYLRTGLGF
jgi:hypothetical protein